MKEIKFAGLMLAIIAGAVLGAALLFSEHFSKEEKLVKIERAKEIAPDGTTRIFEAGEATMTCGDMKFDLKWGWCRKSSEEECASNRIQLSVEEYGHLGRVIPCLVHSAPHETE